MLRSIGIIAATLSGGTAAAQSAKHDLTDPSRVLAEINYGLERVCLPAQREGLTTSEVIRRDRKSLTTRRMRNTSNKRSQIWALSNQRDVAVIEDTSGCTVSTSFEYRDRADLVPDLYTRLSEGATVRPIGEADAKNRRTVFCMPREDGGIDSLLVSEVTRVEDPDVGRRLPTEVLYLSLTVPTEGYCSRSS